VIFTAAPAQAHTDEELDEWVQRWEVQLYWQGGITQDLFMARHEMAERHPCYFWDQCPPPPPHTHQTPLVGNSPAPSPGVSTAVQNAEAWRGLVAAHFPADAVNNMLCIMWKESRGNPSADNSRSTARGLFQVLRSWPISFGYTYADLYDPTINTIVARKVWDLQGYGAWTVWPKCR
jgi:hypothetical protein